MRQMKYMRKSAMAGALALTLAMTGCGMKEAHQFAARSVTDEKSDYAISQAMQEMTTKTDKEKENDKQEKDSQECSLKATFDDGSMTFDNNGLNIKDKNGHVLIHDGKFDIQDEDGNFKLDNDGLVIKDDSTGKDSVKINKDGLYVEDDDCSVSWDKDGFKIKSNDCDLHFSFSFGGKTKAEKKAKTKNSSKSDTEISDSRWFNSHKEQWEKFSQHISRFFDHTLPEVMEDAHDFVMNGDTIRTYRAK